MTSTTPNPPSGPAPVREFTLADVATHPAVETALASTPDVWRNCVFTDDSGRLEDLSLTRAEMTGYVWLNVEDDTWELTLADECFPFLDLDTEAGTEPVLATLRDHAAVEEAYHEDREVFVFVTDRDLGDAEAAVLAVAALAAGHIAALRGAHLTP